MQFNNWKQREFSVGASAAAIVGLLAFLAFQTPVSQPKPSNRSAEPVQLKKAPSISKIRSRRHAKTVLAANRAGEPTSAAGTVPVRFPTPTEITIAVAAAPQLVKMDAYQNPLQADATKWDCVKDVTTSLVWEVKTHDQGLRDANNFYSWFNPGSISQAGSGLKDGGKCRGGISCDTQSYINAVNAKRVCGYSDWRLPTRNELMSLVRGGDAGQKTMIDTRYFPSTPGDWYWTADTDLGDSDHAWYVLFYNGRTMKALKSQAKRVRLVRGGKEHRRSFKDVAEKKDSENRKELAKQPFQPESTAAIEKEMLSQN